MKRAEFERTMHSRPTILFVDEIHRFNKAQQDAFLPHVEAGSIILIGATTENPSFEVNAPLLSRCRVYVLQPARPGRPQVVDAARVGDQTRAWRQLKPEVDDDALDYLAMIAQRRCPRRR